MKLELKTKKKTKNKTAKWPIVWTVQGQPDEFVACPESLDEIERASLSFQVTLL